MPILVQQLEHLQLRNQQLSHPSLQAKPTYLVTVGQMVAQLFPFLAEHQVIPILGLQAEEQQAQHLDLHQELILVPLPMPIRVLKLKV